MPPQIAIFLHGLTTGGAERVLVRLASQLADEGVKLDLVLAETATGPYQELLSNRVRLIELGAPHALLSVRRLARYLRTERPETLLSALNYPNIVASMAVKLARVNVRFITSARNVITPALPHVSLAKRIALPSLLRVAFRSSQQVICVSEGVSADVGRITGLPGERRPVIYNPLDTAAVARKADEPLEHPWILPGQPPLVLGSGRLVKQKGFRTLLQAFSIVRSTRPCRLVILGEGPERAALAEMAHSLDVAEDVYLPGFDENPYRWMRRAAVFTLSSYHEGFPSVLLEAMACGVQVVSTDCPSGPAEILEGGKWGQLVPIADESAMAKALVSAMTTDAPDASNRLSAFAPELIADQYRSVLLPQL